MLQELKSFDANRASIDELMGYAAYGRLLRTEYEVREVEPPEWLGVQLTSLGNEIKAKNRDRLEARLRELNARQESLKTTSEKRAENAREISRLRKALGQTA
jgi:hypothetical protein